MALISLLVMILGLTAQLGCTTLPSCAWGKCASPRSPALIPQMSERVYPLPIDRVLPVVKEHFEQRGYPLARIAEDQIETEPYAEKEMARILGLKYRWTVQVRKMDHLNTAVLPTLYVHEDEKPARQLSPGLWPEPYRYLYYEIERSLRNMLEEERELKRTSIRNLF